MVVTGATGFLGSVLVDTLLAGGQTVVGIDRRPPAVSSTRPGLRLLLADLLDRDERVTDALAEADAVFHLAARPGVRDSGAHRFPDPARLAQLRRRDNVDATARVLDVVPPATPLVVTSSSSVYGGADRVTGRVRPSGEDDPLRPLGGYARTKVAAEQLCGRRLAAGGRVAIARPFTVAGEGQRPDMALARWLAAARAGRPLRVLGSLERSRDVTDVRDVACVLVALAGTGACGPVNVGTGTGHTLAEMLAAVGQAVGVEPVVTLEPAGAEEVRDSLADPRRLQRLVGFVPRTDLAGLVARQARAAGPAAERATVRATGPAAPLPGVPALA